MLHGINILSGLSDAEKKNLEMFCQERQISSGETLFCEGDEAMAMYILKTGKLEVSKKIYGKNTLLGTVVAEEIIGEMALFGNDEKRMATAIATQDCSLITILNFSITEITQKHPELMQRIKDIIEIRNLKNKSTVS